MTRKYRRLETGTRFLTSASQVLAGQAIQTVRFPPESNSAKVGEGGDISISPSFLTRQWRAVGGLSPRARHVRA